MRTSAPNASWTPVLLLLLGVAVLPLLLVFDRIPGGTREEVVSGGKLRVLTLNGPTTYYEGPDGPAGFEFQLLSGFAESLGVSLELMVVDSFASILPRLRRGDAHLAAAGITITEPRRKLVRFSAPYQQIQQQVVYRRGTLRPRKPEDLLGRQLEVVAGTSFSERLRELKVELPQLAWTETSEKGPEELLEEVAQELLELTVADSNLVAVLRQHYPQLRVAFALREPEHLAWAFAPGPDDTLLRVASEYLEQFRDSGELARLLDRHYGATQKFDYVNITTYRRRIVSVLPRYLSWFKEAAQASEIDWRLLAAQAYQESQWRADAVSPTGVKGLMQLTQSTAARFDVADRTDPRASIFGGARYLRNLLDRLPARITEPDRTWLALAAYNVGFGHLEDARVLTQKNGGDPDRWADVSPYLLKLTKPLWYRQTRYGYARGGEAVSYVTRIRSFYSILRRIDESGESVIPAAPTPTLEAPAL